MEAGGVFWSEQRTRAGHAQWLIALESGGTPRPARPNWTLLIEGTPSFSIVQGLRERPTYQAQGHRPLISNFPTELRLIPSFQIKRASFLFKSTPPIPFQGMVPPPQSKFEIRIFGAQTR